MVSLKIFGIISISVGVFSIVAGIPICKIWKRFSKTWSLLLIVSLFPIFIGAVLLVASFFESPEKLSVDLTSFWLHYALAAGGLIFVLFLMEFVMAFGNMVDGIYHPRPFLPTVLLTIITGLETIVLVLYLAVR